MIVKGNAVAVDLQPWETGKTYIYCVNLLVRFVLLLAMGGARIIISEGSQKTLKVLPFIAPSFNEISYALHET